MTGATGAERLTLYSQSHSPYARKTIVFAHEAGLADRIAVVDHETSPTNRNPEVFAVNPLGKVPVLMTPEAGAIFDSLVICDYLDGLHGGPRLIPIAGKPRWQALRLHAVAQGLCDAGIALRWETARRPEHLRYPPLSEGQTTKLVASYDLLEQDGAFDEPVHIGHIGLGYGAGLARIPRAAGFPRRAAPADALVRDVLAEALDARDRLSWRDTGRPGAARHCRMTG